MLLVMDTAEIFHSADARGGSNPSALWEITWERIDCFLPHLRDELFKQTVIQGRARANLTRTPQVPTPSVHWRVDSEDFPSIMVVHACSAQCLGGECRTCTLRLSLAHCECKASLDYSEMLSQRGGKWSLVGSQDPAGKKLRVAIWILCLRPHARGTSQSKTSGLYSPDSCCW